MDVNKWGHSLMVPDDNLLWQEMVTYEKWNIYLYFSAVETPAAGFMQFVKVTTFTDGSIGHKVW